LKNPGCTPVRVNQKKVDNNKNMIHALVILS